MTTLDDPTTYSLKPVRGFNSLRIHLILAFALLALLPIVVISVVLIFSSTRSSRLQTLQQLETVAEYKEAAVQDWSNLLQSDLASALIGADAGSLLEELSNAPRGTRQYQETYAQVKNHFYQGLLRTQNIKALFLTDPDGRVVYATNFALENQDLSGEPFFRAAQDQPSTTVYRPFYDIREQSMVLVALKPIQTGGKTAGYLGAYANPDRLAEIIQETTGLGETGLSYLVDRSYTVLAGGRPGQIGLQNRTNAVQAGFEHQSSGTAGYQSFRSVPVLGAFRYLPELDSVLVIEQSVQEANRSLTSLLVANGSVALVSLLIAAFAALKFTGSLGRSIAELAETATRFAAGAYELRAPVRRRDEIGVLAMAFNRMTAQIRSLIANLESLVAERTGELERRTRYLEASSQVSQATASILDPQELVSQAVAVIQDRFDLYYVGLFLKDESGQWALLRAGTGEAGQAMLQRSHRLKIGGGSMIGWCIDNARARVAQHAEEDPVRAVIAELPETRSEAAIPLRSRGRVIGALSVQSAEPQAFDSASLAVLQIMADQLATALENARLFSENLQALEAERRAYGQASRRDWQAWEAGHPGLGYQSDHTGVQIVAPAWRSEVEQALQEGKPVHVDEADRQTLAIPIKVRGNVIGLLDTYKLKADGHWQPEEIEVLETIADQLALALDSARLYEETQRRAERERLAGEITAKVRATNDPQAILQTAVQELRQALHVRRAQVLLKSTEPGLTQSGNGEKGGAHP